jgi:hypothetical protein
MVSDVLCVLLQTDCTTPQINSFDNNGISAITEKKKLARHWRREERGADNYITQF